MLRAAIRRPGPGSLAAPPPPMAADGAQLFNLQCKFCHGGVAHGPEPGRRRGPARSREGAFAYLRRP